MDDNGDGTFDRGERYVYDEHGGLEPVLFVFDEAGDLVSRSLHGEMVDELFATETATGQVLWALTDHIGSVRDIAERDSGTGDTEVVNHIRYDAFGSIASQTDPGTSSTPTDPDVLLAGFRTSFTGREWDADADLFYYRARWYDPQAGRFISEDPISFNAGDANLYRYVANSPTLAVDPSGLMLDAGSDASTVYLTDLVNRSDPSKTQQLEDPGRSWWDFATQSSPAAVLLRDMSAKLDNAITDLAVSTEVPWIAAVGGFTGDIAGTIGNMAAMGQDNPLAMTRSMIEGMSAAVKESFGVWQEHGTALGILHTLGIHQVASAWMGIDLSTGVELSERDRYKMHEWGWMRIATITGVAAIGKLQVPGRVQSRINIPNKDWMHVLDRHYGGGGSPFTIPPYELKLLLKSKSVVSTPISRTLPSNAGLRFVREVPVGRTIGFDKFKGFAPTDMMTVLTDEFGNLVTASPGIIH